MVDYEDSCMCDNVTDIDIHRYECNECGNIGYRDGDMNDKFQ